MLRRQDRRRPKAMIFLPVNILKTWTGTPFRKGQIQQLQDWGYRQGKDYWIRRNGSLAVKAELLQAHKPVIKPTEPDFSALGPQAQNEQASSATRLHSSRTVSASP